jgi:hypothetical protein
VHAEIVSIEAISVIGLCVQDNQLDRQVMHRRPTCQTGARTQLGNRCQSPARQSIKGTVTPEPRLEVHDHAAVMCAFWPSAGWTSAA